MPNKRWASLTKQSRVTCQRDWRLPSETADNMIGFIYIRFGKVMFLIKIDWLIELLYCCWPLTRPVEHISTLMWKRHHERDTHRPCYLVDNCVISKSFFSGWVSFTATCCVYDWSSSTWHTYLLSFMRLLSIMLVDIENERFLNDTLSDCH